LKEFLKAEYKSSDILVMELTPIFVEKFFLFLQSDHNCNNNTALKFVQRFRTVFNYIKSTGADIKIDPFVSFRFKTKKVVRELLTQEEIDTVYNKDFLTERFRRYGALFRIFSLSVVIFIYIYLNIRTIICTLLKYSMVKINK